MPHRPPWPSHGAIVCRWMESCLVHGEGDRFGEPFRLRPEQKLFLYRWYEHHGDGRWRYRKAFLETPKGWGKTELAAAMALAEFCGPVAPKSPNVPVAAASFEQAGLLFGRAKEQATHERSPLAASLEAFDTEIQIIGRPGRMFRVAAVAGTNDGGLPTLFVADEVHEWQGDARERVHLVIGNSLAKRRNGRELNLSTPGHDSDSLAGRLHELGIAGTDAELLHVWHTADPKWNLDDTDELEAAIREANTHADDDLVANLVRRHGEIPEHEFRRYHLAQWVETPAEAWLPAGAWDACREPGATIPAGSEVVLAVDLALKHDSTAVVAAHRRDMDGRIAVSARVWDNTPEAPMDVTDVLAHIRGWASTHRVRAVVYDPRFFDLPARQLEDEGFTVIEVPQSPERMVPLCGQAYEAILARRVAHDGDRVLAAHVAAAVPRQSDRGWSLSKGKSRRKIDACIAFVLALGEIQSPSTDAVSVYESRGLLTL